VQEVTVTGQEVSIGRHYGSETRFFSTYVICICRTQVSNCFSEAKYASHHVLPFHELN
jgi:hypothetical protein